MSGPRSPLNALISVDVDAARVRILAEARRHRGIKRHMAQALGVSECTMHRTIKRLGLSDDIARIVADCLCSVDAAGLPAFPVHKPKRGRPKGRKSRKGAAGLPDAA